MKAAVYDKSGKKKGERDLPPTVFSTEFSKSAGEEIVVAELRNRRQGTHKTKGISEISGGGKKPWRQKGTGHARQGSIRAPQFRGGATVFGPVPRDYSIRVPATKRRAGLRAILSKKAADGTLCVLEGFVAEDFSTKAVRNVFNNIGVAPEARVSYISDVTDLKTTKSFANLERIGLMSASRLTAPELYYADHVVIADSALAAIEAVCAKKGKRQAGK